MEKNKLMMIIIIVLLLVLLGTIIGVSVYTFSVINSVKNEQTENGQNNNAPPEKITTYTIEKPFKTNLLGGQDGKQHVISVTVSMAIGNDDEEASAKLMEEIIANEEMAKSKVLRVIRNKTYEELSQTDAQDILANDILVVLQEAFKTNLIVDVFVSEMYVS